MSGTATVVHGDRVRVSRLVGGEPIDPPAEYEVHSEGPDSEGDIRVNNGAGGYLWAREWEKVESHGETAVMNPTVAVGDMVKVMQVLPLAVDRYREALVGTIRKVYRVEGPERIRVELTSEEIRSLNVSDQGLITGWVKVEEEGPAEENPVVTPGVMVWVYEYADDGGDTSISGSYHQRLAAWGSTSEGGTPVGTDGDGNLRLRPQQEGTRLLPLKAKRWTRPGPDATPWNLTVPAGVTVRVYEYASNAFVPGTDHSDMHGSYDLRVATYGNADSDGDLRLNSEASRGSYAKRWLVQGESHRETPVEEKPEPDWGHLIRLLREVMDEHANDPESGDKWCSEYEDTLDKLFNWTSDRVNRCTYEVKVRLRRSVSADDVVNSDAAFGGYYEDVDVDDDDITIEGIIRVNVEGDGEDGPDRDEVESVLDDRGFQYDSFEIIDHEPID